MSDIGDTSDGSGENVIKHGTKKRNSHGRVRDVMIKLQVSTHESGLDYPEPVRVRRHRHADGGDGWSDQDIAMDLSVFVEDIGVCVSMDPHSDEFDCFSLVSPNKW
ncbi:hypothetical protein J6590_081181 [Homalodisca vitripennis]|nr:hypothetical protein J6590_081181 [Homalodisca vitripennis]